MDFARMAISQAWQLTALIVFALVATRLVAKNRPHLAYMLWLVVLLKCVTPPLWSSPSGAFSWVLARLSEDTSAEPLSDPSDLPAKLGVDIEVSSLPMPETDDVLISVQPLDFHANAAPDRSQAVESNEIRATALRVVAAAWGVGILLAIMLAACRWLICMRKLRRSPAIESPELEALLVKLCDELKVRRRVRLLVTTSRVGPAVIGFLRPLIVLPELVVRGKRPQELEAILAHELIHVRRGDLWLGLLQVCAKAVWWFYPLVWWVSRLSTREAERCCDEEVIGELGCDPKRYASSLLDVLELKRTLQPVPVFPGMKPVEVTSQRLERIMKLGQGCHKRTPRWCWAIMLLLAAAALPGAAFIVADEDTAPKDFRNQPWRAKRADFVSDREAGSSSIVPATVHVPDGGTVLIGGTNRFKAIPNSVVAYSSDVVLAKLQRQLDCDKSEALQTFGNLLIFQAQLADTPLPLVDRIRVRDDSIHIAAPADEHQRLRAAVERMEKHGVAHLTIDVRFVSVSEQVVSRRIKDWELTPVDLGDERIDGQQQRLRSPFERPLPTEDSVPIAKAGVTTTTNLSSVYKIVDEDDATELLKDLQKDKRTRILATPKVMLFSGQSATVADSVQRPFVVGMKQIGGDKQGFEPQIRVVESGTVLRVRPLLRDGDKLWLDYEMQVTRLEEVSERTVHVAGRDEPVTLQVPTVFAAQIESAIAFDLGKTVIIGGLPAAAGKGKKNQLLVIMSVVRLGLLGENAVRIEEARTGKLMFGAGVNSDAGIIGAIDVDEREAVHGGEHKTTPILGPLKSGGPVTAIDPPTDEEVLRAAERAENGPMTWPNKAGRFDGRIVKEKIADYVDPVRFLPTLGPAQLHHAHYVCTIYFSVWEDVSFPIPHKIEKEEKRVVYIDHAHFHLVDDVGQKESNTELLQGKLEQKGSIHLRDATFSMWMDAIEKEWDVAIIHHIDDGTALSADFVDTPLNEVLAAILPFQGCEFRCAEGWLLVKQSEKGWNSLIEGKGSVHSELVYPAVYNVADLIAEDLEHMTPDDFESDEVARMRRNLDLLEKVIPMLVLPDSWESTGGKGAIESFATNLSLVVSQTKDGHRGVTKFLGDARKRLNLPTTATFPQPPKPRAVHSDKAISRIYNVADLVIPVPNFNPSGKQTSKQRTLGKLPKDTALADFDTLIDLITSTVAPETWDKVGGTGKIEPFPTNLSLVVSHTSEVHEQIAGLLQQLRKLQDVQVTIEAVFVHMPKDLFRRTGFDFQTVNGRRRDFESEPLLESGWEVFTESEVMSFMKATQTLGEASSLAAPKVTLFNGQQASVSVSNANSKESATLQLQPVCSDDHSSVRLSFGAGVGQHVEVKTTATIQRGHSLIVDVSESITSESLGVSADRKSAIRYLGNIPYVSRLFKNTPQVEEMQTLMLLTPQIIVQNEQQEQKIMLGGVTPRIILQEEEEELLGLESLSSE